MSRGSVLAVTSFAGGLKYKCAGRFESYGKEDHSTRLRREIAVEVVTYVRRAYGA